MRKVLLFATALTALAMPAMAADLIVKAPPPIPFTSAYSAFYWGIGTYAGVAQSNVSSSNLFATSLVSSGLTADGAGVSGILGYQHGSTALVGFGNWWRVQGDVSYQNIQGGILIPGASASIASRWAAEQEFDVGADVLTYIMSALGPSAAFNFPTFTPQLPANIQVGIPKQYFGAIVREFGMGTTVAASGPAGSGSSHGVSIGVAPGIKTGFLFPTMGLDGKTNGGGIDLWASVSWATKGATLNNVFASDGTPLTTGPGAMMGTTYLTGVSFLRGF